MPWKLGMAEVITGIQSSKNPFLLKTKQKLKPFVRAMLITIVFGVKGGGP